MADLLDISAAAKLADELLVMAAKGLAILLIVTAACVALRQASASLKHLCWGLGLGAVLVLPLLTLVVPNWNVGFLEGRTGLQRTPEPVFDRGAEILASPPGVHAPPVASSTSPEASHESAPKAQATSVPDRSAAEASKSGAVYAARAGAAQSAAASSAAAQTGVASSAAARSAGSQAAAAQSGPTQSVGTARDSGAGAEASAPMPAEKSVGAWILGIWALGAVTLVLHMMISSLLVRRIVRRAHPVTDRAWLDTLDEIGDRLFIRREVRLLESSRVSVPVACGGIRPIVLIPPGAEAWSEERRRCVLAHELAHVKRWDTVTQPAARLACAVHWFNPLAWKAARAMQLEREKACDDYVLTISRARASEYASHLLDIARRAPGSISPPVGAIAMARRSQLEGRVLAILDEGRRRSLARPPIATAVIAALLVVLPIAAMSPYEAPRSEEIERSFIEPLTPGAIAIDGERPRSHPEVQASSVQRGTSSTHDERAATYDQKAETYDENVVRTSPDTIERTFNVADGGLLMIDADHGNVRLRSGASNQAQVRVRRLPRGRAAAEDYEVSFKQEGDKISVVGTNRIRNSGRDGVSVDFEVTVPHRFNVDAETAGGNIAVENLNGRVRLNTSGGNLSLGRISGEVDAHTSGGNISLDGSDADVVVNTSGGNISLGRVGGTVKATTSGGNISVDEVNGQITARTSGGQILARIARQPTASSVLRTSGGGITVYLAEGIAVDLDAKTSAGHVETDVEVSAIGRVKKDELRGKINGGGPLLELDTSAGSIHIRKL